MAEAGRLEQGAPDVHPLLVDEQPGEGVVEAFGAEVVPPPVEEFPGTPVELATDATAAAHAEARWGSLAGADPAVYLNLGTGLAAAIVIDGRVLVGRDGAAGEIGYNLREVADVGLRDGNRLMLEDMVSGMALRRRASAPGRQLSAADVFDHADDEVGLDDLITAVVDELAFHLVNLAILVNPARIAAGGGMTRSWDRIQPRLTEALRAGVPYPPDLVLAHFPNDAPLLGAVALAVDAANQSGSVTGADYAPSTMLKEGIRS